MKTYLCVYAKGSFFTIYDILQKAFPNAQFICSDVDPDTFFVHAYGVDDLDALDDVMAEFVWEG